MWRPDPRQLKRIAVLLGMLMTTSPLWACSVPVFRYSLERWPADPYEVAVFHRGELTEAQQAIVNDLGQEGKAGELFANVRVMTVDLDADPDEALLKLWEAQKEIRKSRKTEALPWVVVHYPWMTRIPVPVWSGPLAPELVQTLLDSPFRREVARRLVKGETAVWVFLESGNKAEDDKAFGTLTEELKKLEEMLKPPEVDEADIAQGNISIDPDQLQIKFATLRLARDVPAEKMFIEMMLGSEPDLRELKEPMVFPIFGRGRALYALVGAGINEDNVAEAGYFLTGPCSCTVKAQNPGADMLMAVDWDTLISPYSDVDIDEALPPLAGLGAFGAEMEIADAQDSSADAEESQKPGDSSADAEESQKPGDATEEAAHEEQHSDEGEHATPPVSTSPPTPTTAVTGGSNPLLRNILIVAIIAIGVVLAGSIVLARKS